MNKSESKYFSTAVKMDEAFLTLLESKELTYITVKEICKIAKVNRSTFYLHYESIDDLLLESVNYMNKQFLIYMGNNTNSFISKLAICSLNELYLITPEYLTPYLNYIKENQRLFSAALEKSNILHLDDNYLGLFQHILIPILDRYGVIERDRDYMLQFYINGIIAIITK